MIAVQELEAAREVMRRRMPIGEPAVALNPTHVLVSSKTPTEIHIRMDHLIELVEGVLKANLKVDET